MPDLIPRIRSAYYDWRFHHPFGFWFHFRHQLAVAFGGAWTYHMHVRRETTTPPDPTYLRVQLHHLGYGTPDHVIVLEVLDQSIRDECHRTVWADLRLSPAEARLLGRHLYWQPRASHYDPLYPEEKSAVRVPDLFAMCKHCGQRPGRPYLTLCLECRPIAIEAAAACASTRDALSRAERAERHSMLSSAEVEIMMALESDA